ncbi:hypothetical protein CCR83_00395 [Rhodobacter veldkampii DSM 11550]|uniref:Cation/multidrug efflux pump n=2 Tax=Phaeovulum veldkampii TaxID=33049 RepID=A0A2T4JMN5_9RHOB|nr:hypothetical protein [Phaeovulum veldkampii DSM 11550]NCU20403.1 hypothetical protein [Candidatus Falkowbacteria bacterium]PTE19156.1 hypothetical protein C5F46_01050 [Phaeovulum veldkampii DSM 11550]
MVRGAALALIVLTIIFVVVRIYARSVRREALEKEWDAAYLADENPEARADYIDRGMATYERSLARRLVWLVYVIPLGLAALTAFAVNHQWN